VPAAPAGGQNGATLVDSMDDIVSELFPHLHETKKIENSKETQNLNFNENENKILACLAETPMHIDEIIEKSKLDVSETHTILMTLALSGIIKEIGLAQFIKV
jgi:predicted Rossmann fold nucleotide-binding protein DprA/Smf involved in DNA uptake